MDIKKRAGLCPMCKKRNHPLAPDIDGDVCDDCFTELLKKSSPIICNNCKSLVGIVEKGVTESGFEFEAGTNYTVDFCKFCRPFTTKLEINELNNYLKSNNIPKDNFLY